MKVLNSSLPGVRIVQPDVITDARGYLLEMWSTSRYSALGIPEQFAQDNLSWSRKGVLRGLHLQHPSGQGKLVTVALGSVFDVAVDVRVGSPTFTKWTGQVLSQENHRQMYIPPGFAHGFCVLSDTALVIYKCTAPYDASTELGIAFNDPDIDIAWPVSDPVLSPKDSRLPCLNDLRGILPPFVG